MHLSDPNKLHSLVIYKPLMHLQVILSHDKRQSSHSNLMTMKENNNPEKHDLHRV